MTEHGHEVTAYRTRMVGRLRVEDAGADHRLVGWAHRRRDLGGLVFIDLRDRSGLLQVSFGPDWTDEESLERIHGVGQEDVLQVEGEVVLRPEDARNPEIETGDVELRARSVRILNEAETPAIPVYQAPGETLPAEELRLRHRVLDLRRAELRDRLLLRHRIVHTIRVVMDRLGFVEVETPILTKPTPEGARDYLVPSRNHPGEFYALPQSPQIYKQILMVSGFDRYFQIARCFRDEDLRADRQPEFTQLDLEASFVEPDDILGWMEELVEEVAEAAGIRAPTPFRRMEHREAMERYGSDRPDLRIPLEIRDWTDTLKTLDFRIFRSAVEEGGRIRGFYLPGGADLSRKDLDALEAVARGAGAPGLLWLKRTDDGGSGPLARFMTDEAYDAVEMSEGDLILVAAGPDSMTSPVLGAVRPHAAEAAGIEPVAEHAWLWITDFPLFEVESGGDVGGAHGGGGGGSMGARSGAAEGEVGGGPRLVPGHHPFVLPHPDDMDLLDRDPARARGVAYDLVYNGAELGSGSLRIHEPGLQRRVLRILGLEDEEIDRKFGFLLEALSAGAPPHGGIALGIARIVRELSGAPSLRDVIAFPKTTAARALYEGAPSPVTDAELRELHLRVVGGESRGSGS
ncbi:MAG: aspartate--tRNA ligase [Longimicrobiales bacterium]